MKTTPKNHGRCPAFTLVELLIVITIIAVLAALSLTAVRSLKGRAHAATSLSNIKQLYSGHLLYLSEYGHFPSANDWTSTISAERDASCRTWHERIAPFIGLGKDLEQTQVQFVKDKLPPGAFKVPGRKRLVGNNGGTGGGYRAGYGRSRQVYVNDPDVAQGSSFKTFDRIGSLSSSYFLIDMGGESVENDFNGWQIDAATRLKWPAHGGEAGKLKGSVVVCYFDGHLEAREKGTLPTDYKDVFWTPVIN